MVHTYRRIFAGRPLEVEIGKLAGQANGACRVQYGETVLLVTATASREPRPGIDFFPLTVDYEERLYAAGKIPGSFFRREGRPTTEAILAGRLTDRAIRPLFPKGFRNDVQVIITILSADQENDPDTWGTVGASIALGVSDIPFGGPISSVRVGYIDGEFIANPTFEQRDRSELDLVVAATHDAVVMVEAGAKQVPEAVVLEAMRFGFQANQELLELQEEIIRELGKPKMVFTPTPMTDEVRQVVAEWAADKVNELIPITERAEREAGVAERREELLERFGETYTAEQLLGALDEEIKKAVRRSILEENRRPDGRTPTELRPITCEVGLLPRTHGSGLFQRGQTQVMTIATLGSLGEEQRLDTLEPEETKRFIHHYNFPPFSVGEARRLGPPGRREIGHGALAERALEPVIPKVDDFPYTIRLVSEVLSSNGSTSMASVCGSTLALMDAGVPISDPVAGVAMGLVMGEDGRFAILTDIAGVEDALGDMDFKVAGTATGITALQMDIKITGLTFEILEQALAQAREARLFILEKIREVIPEARPELSRYAPRIYRIKIPPEKIGTVIGPGGRVIRSIIDETKTTIDIQDDGTVFIGASSEDAARQAILIIEGLTKEVEVGQIYTGKVTRLTNFGAFVEIMPGKEGLVHISELADYRVPRVEDVVQVGDEIMVMVTEIDPLGRINLSRRAVLEGETPQAVAERASERVSGGRREGGPPRRNGGDRGLRGGNGRAGGVRPEPRRAPTSRGGGGPGFGARRSEGPSGPLPPPRPPFRGR